MSSVVDMESWKIQKALEIKEELEKFLFSDDLNSITNKSKRNIKKLFNRQINLTDNMFKGFHNDGRLIGSLGNDDEEKQLICDIFRKTPTISFNKAKEIVRKWINANCIDYTKKDLEYSGYASKKHELIVGGYLLYEDGVSKKLHSVKTRGLDLVDICANYWKLKTEDPVIEEQINKACQELKDFITPSFDDKFTFEDFRLSIVLLLDISGSMAGKPLNTGLFFILMMIKIFGIKQINFFESSFTFLTIKPDWSSNLELMKQFYTNSMGSTMLNTAFEFFDKQKIQNKNIIIITDGDCDPCHSDYVSNNPFHEATRIDKSNSKYPNIINCNFIILNVKEEKMNFPYLNIDPMVCYITGNNPKTINGLIKALCASVKTKTIITPEIVLEYTLDLDELVFEGEIPALTNSLSDTEIETLFTVFTKNIPPKKTIV